MNSAEVEVCVVNSAEVEVCVTSIDEIKDAGMYNVSC
jgi:hypothetical protein